MTALKRRHIDDNNTNDNGTRGIMGGTSGGLRESIRQRLQSIALSYQEDDEHDALDVYRALQHEAGLLFHTQRVKDHLYSDPFERFRDEPHLRAQLGRLCQSVRVTQLDHVSTKTGYVSIEASVQILPLQGKSASSHPKKKRSHNNNPPTVALSFRYEREAISATSTMEPSSVRYAIDFCRDGECGPKLPLLRVHVFAAGGTPSPNGADCLNIDEDDAVGWSDMEDDESQLRNETGEAGQEMVIANRKNMERVKASDRPPAVEASSSSSSSASSADPRDRFTASIDPDVLQSFVDGVQFGDLDDATVFFLLMSFPFYEHEWDLVGFVLDSVFGAEDDEDASDDDGSAVDDNASKPAQTEKPRSRKGI